jgi:hypothetical protein
MVSAARQRGALRIPNAVFLNSALTVSISSRQLIVSAELSFRPPPQRAGIRACRRRFFEAEKAPALPVVTSS